MAAAVILLVAATGAVAQGKGRGLAKKGTNLPASPSSTAAIAAGAPVGFRQFGSWLDDASLMDPRWAGARTIFPSSTPASG